MSLNPEAPSTTKLEEVVKRELRATLEAFDGHIAQMRLANERLRALFDAFLEAVERNG